MSQKTYERHGERHNKILIGTFPDIECGLPLPASWIYRAHCHTLVNIVFDSHTTNLSALPFALFLCSDIICTLSIISACDFIMFFFLWYEDTVYMFCVCVIQVLWPQCLHNPLCCYLINISSVLWYYCVHDPCTLILLCRLSHYYCVHYLCIVTWPLNIR